MSSGKFISVEPAEIRFSDVMKIHICTLLVTNNTNKHVAFKVMTTNPVKYRVDPFAAVLLPWSTRHVAVETREECEFPTDVQCNDKFKIQSLITNERTTEKDVTSAMFTQKSITLVQECKLKVFSTHKDPLLVPIQLNDVSSIRASISDDGPTQILSCLQIPKADVEHQEHSSELTQKSITPIQECKLKDFSTHKDPSPVPYRIMEGSSTRASVSDDGPTLIVSCLQNPKADEENQEQSSEIMKNASLQRRTAKPESIVKIISELETDKPRQFSHEELIGFTANFSNKLGSGAFGDVYKGKFPNGEKIAVKVLVENEVVGEEFVGEEFMAEVSTMGRTYHRNLVKLYGFCFDDNMKALVYEYASNGSFDYVLYENRFDLKWEKLYDIAVETAKALEYLHEGCYDKIIHHDIKPANVLLDLNFSPKITDFGLAKLMNRNMTHLIMTRVRGTVGYAAPETFMQFSEITYKCDVYSFGMMLFEILGRRRNVTSEAWFAKQVWEKFVTEQLDEIIEECGITGENKVKARILSFIALWCIQHTPATRPSMSTVSTMLEKEIQVTTPPNPFLPSLPIYSMQPSQHSQESVHSDVSSS